MSATLHKPLRRTQFLAWEERQELRYEFDGFQPVAMTGGTVAHDRITLNPHKCLDARLAGKSRRPPGPNIKIIVDGRARYPDAIIVCHPGSPNASVVDDPGVVFEVLSDGTANTDRIAKNREYRATPSIQRYVSLEQTHAAAIVFVRAEPDWLSEIVAGDNAILHLSEIGIDLLLDKINGNVGLSQDRADDPHG